jgi:DNA-binding MarR family transcriptional regulator
MSIPLDERLGTYIRRADQELMAVKHDAVRPAGLTVPQYTALYTLSAAPGMSTAALSRSCAVTPQTMATVLKTLQERGLVERRPHQWHRNVIETHVTAAGQSALQTADEAASNVERHLAAAFTPAERSTLTALLNRCAEALRSEREDLRQAHP